MGLTVKKTLSRLKKQRLRALCRKRNLDVPQKWGKCKLVKKLARSSDLASVLGDLRRPELIAVAKEFLLCCDTSTASASLVQTAADQTRLHSTGSIGGVPLLDTDKLRADARDACRATVISAYYVCDVLRELLDGCGEVRVLLNGLGGRRLDDQIEELTELARELQDSNGYAEIKLAFSRGIFHTKLYLFESETESVAWIGSANATNAALGAQTYNEEILLRLAPAPSSLRKYAECAWINGQTLEGSRPPVDSLAAFFRTGNLYYKPYSTLPMTYNPFRKLLEVLSREEKSRLSTDPPPYADEGTAIGAFNIRHVHEESNEAIANGEESKSRTRIRSYAIETCYGYWVAAPFVQNVENVLDQSSKTKDDYLLDLCKWLQGSGRKQIIRAYKGKYLKSVRWRMGECNIDWKKVLEVHNIPDPFQSAESIKKRIEIVRNSLKQESRRKRYSHAFVSMHVPEIWDDVATRQQFEDTFFESLAEQSYKPKKHTAAKRLLEAIGIYCETTPEEIRKALEKRLGDPDWYNREFAHSDAEA